jgi:hypothetical protein
VSAGAVSAGAVSAGADPRARLAWRGALLAAALNAVGSPLELVVARGVVAVPRWAPLGAGAVGVVMIVLLLLQRHRPTRGGAAAAFLVNTASIVAMLCFCNARWATLGAHWAPFQANKLGALTVALLTPELAVGVVSIAAYAGAAVIQFALLEPSLRASLARGEPMVTCIFAAFGVVMLVMSARRFALERRIVEQQREAAALEELARAFLAVRDFANTPLQTIESAAAVARMLHPEARPQLDQIERALARLRKLNQLLSRHEAHVRWREGDESFDAATQLEDSVAGERNDKH